MLKFQYDMAEREKSELRKNTLHTGNGDCSIRAFSLATGKSYDQILMEFANNPWQKKSPTISGTNMACENVGANNGFKKIYFYKSALNNEPWIDPFKVPTLNRIFEYVPDMGSIDILVETKGHIFFVNKGVIRDSHSESHKRVQTIFVHKEQYNSAYGWLRDNFTVYGLVHRLIEMRKKYPNLTWRAIGKAMGLRPQEDQKLRKTLYFATQVQGKEKDWILK